MAPTKQPLNAGRRLNQAPRPQIKPQPQPQLVLHPLAPKPIKGEHIDEEHLEVLVPLPPVSKSAKKRAKAKRVKADPAKTSHHRTTTTRRSISRRLHLRSSVGMPYNTTAIPPRKEPTGTTQLPLSRVKKTVQADPDIQAFSNAAAFVLTRATELFTQMLAEKAHEVAKSEKKPRRNLQYRDIATAVANHENLQFLGDTVPKTMTYGEYLKRAAAKAGANKTKTNGQSAVEAGQTTLHGMKSAAATNGTNGFGTHAAKLGEERGEDEDERREDADPNEQLKKESLGPRLSSGSTISNSATYVNGKEGREDVEMS